MDVDNCLIDLKSSDSGVSGDGPPLKYRRNEGLMPVQTHRHEPLMKSLSCHPQDDGVMNSSNTGCHI